MEEFVEIIKILDTDGEPSLIDLQKKTLEAVTPAQIRALISELEGRLKEISQDVRLAKEIPFLEFFLAHCYKMSMSPSKAMEQVRQATEKFKYRNNEYNAALAHWYLGLLYGIDKQPDLCRAEMTESAKLLRKIEKDYAEKGRYLDRDKIRELLVKIKNDIDDASHAPFRIRPKIKKRKKTQDDDTSAQQENSSSPLVQVVFPINFDNHNVFSPSFSPTLEQNNCIPGRIYGLKNGNGTVAIPSGTTTELSQSETEDYVELPWIPVYHSVTHANVGQGTEWVEPPDEERAEINSVIIAERSYWLESTLLGIHKVTLTEGRDYGFVKVDGQSMNTSRPPIEHGNYVLFYKSNDVEGNVNKIIIASRPLTKGYSYLIKQLKRRHPLPGQSVEYELVSHTSESGPEYDSLPLGEDYGILGVVIAVAKPTD
jgi:hypothetical protein